MVTMLCGPQARGTVRLQRSATPDGPPDPYANPLIDHAYLSSPLDVAVLAEGCRLAHEVVLDGSKTKDHVVGAWPVGTVHPQNAQEWREYVRAQAGTCYHPGGTCRMGPDGDEWAVVDERLRVRGVLGLRVAGESEGLCSSHRSFADDENVVDCSIMPWINNGHTQVRFLLFFLPVLRLSLIIAPLIT